MNCADENEEGDQQEASVSLGGGSRGKRVVQWEYDPSDLIKVRHPFCALYHQQLSEDIIEVKTNSSLRDLLEVHLTNMDLYTLLSNVTLWHENMI